MITSEERKGKITTVQRFIVNDVFRETLGIDQSDPEQLQRTCPKEEFDIMAKRFVRELIQGTNVTSRMNKPQIMEYARPLNSVVGTAFPLTRLKLDRATREAKAARRRGFP
jgi:hypothetical protein